jgi:hypothetical protein
MKNKLRNKIGGRGFVSRIGFDYLDTPLSKSEQNKKIFFADTEEEKDFLDFAIEEHVLSEEDLLNIL